MCPGLCIFLVAPGTAAHGRLPAFLLACMSVTDMLIAIRDSVYICMLVCLLPVCLSICRLSSVVFCRRLCIGTETLVSLDTKHLSAAGRRHSIIDNIHVPVSSAFYIGLGAPA